MKHRIRLRREVPAARLARPLTTAARAALSQARAPRGEMTIVLTDSRRMRRLNARFAGQDHVTDVLAFPSAASDPRGGPRYFGDVVIALPRARLQARRRGVPLPQEVSLLAVHGTLHLLGLDHDRPASRRRMWRLQAAVLRHLGLDPEQLEVAP
ncbi:MAG TPA: rRNA maturation RNase YbeY [Anaerolineales bacterium]|nr:rRNA maturation RNase YbeY [Anaerolineales bacterium]